MADLVPRDDDDDAVRDYFELGALFANIVPVFGGAVSNVLTGWSQARRMARVREVLEHLARDLTATRQAIREDYIRSDEFEDLLDQTLRRVAAERHEAKRRLYAAFLAGAVTSPGEPYHEQLRFLRTLEELQPDHIRIIGAMLQEPPRDSGASGGMGSISQTLRLRLPDIPPDRIADLAEQLAVELRVATTDRQVLNGMMSGHAAEDLRDRFTPYGKRLVSYLRSALEKGDA